MKRSAPLIWVCREATFHNKHIRTIVDEACTYEHGLHPYESAAKWTICYALIAGGFKFADEIDTRDAINEYLRDDIYGSDLFHELEHVRLYFDRPLPADAFKEELVARVFHPSCIEQWVSAGNHPETFLN